MNNEKSTTDYDYKEQLAINRRTNMIVNDKQVIAQRLYIIGGKKYIVNSCYDIGSQFIENGIKRLIDNNSEKAS